VIFPNSNGRDDGLASRLVPIAIRPRFGRFYPLSASFGSFLFFFEDPICLSFLRVPLALAAHLVLDLFDLDCVRPVLLLWRHPKARRAQHLPHVDRQRGRRRRRHRGTVEALSLDEANAKRVQATSHAFWDADMVLQPN
jgi:hypothetical protein